MGCVNMFVTRSQADGERMQASLLSLNNTMAAFGQQMSVVVRNVNSRLDENHSLIQRTKAEVEETKAEVMETKAEVMETKAEVRQVHERLNQLFEHPIIALFTTNRDMKAREELSWVLNLLYLVGHRTDACMFGFFPLKDLVGLHFPTIQALLQVLVPAARNKRTVTLNSLMLMFSGLCTSPVDGPATDKAIKAFAFREYTRKNIEKYGFIPKKLFIQLFRAWFGYLTNEYDDEEQDTTRPVVNEARVPLGLKPSMTVSDKIVQYKEKQGPATTVGWDSVVSGIASWNNPASKEFLVNQWEAQNSLFLPLLQGAAERGLLTKACETYQELQAAGEVFYLGPGWVRLLSCSVGCF